jgi:ribosomal-protein-alanine N-acetyltransferase
MAAVVIRRGGDRDLEAVARIQRASPEAAQWEVSEYLRYELLVAECDDAIAGFAVWRQVAEDERELLNLAVDPAFRRHGIGRRLVAELCSGQPGALWLEVRESNHAARKFYIRMGFQEAGGRRGYYSGSSESAIVMNFHS